MTGQNLSLEERLEVHALLDRLTAPGLTFVRKDALRLIQLIPIQASRRFTFTGVFRGRGPGMRGRAAGVGDVGLEGEGREKQVSWNAPASHKIGGYVVTHTTGQISIELMWSETREDHSGESCILGYDPATGEPQKMRVSVQRTLTILFVRFAYITYVPWKKPADEG